MRDIMNAGKQRITMNTRIKTMLFVSFAAGYLLIILIWGGLMPEEWYAVSYADKFLPPSAAHPFGTDFMGRDMFFRTIKGLSNSLVIGIISAAVSSVIGLLFGIGAAMLGGWLDKTVLLLVDCFMGIPHIVLLILISVLLGKGQTGVMAAVALTHWPELTRLVRSEVLQVRSSLYVQAAYKLGQSRFQIAWSHVLPHAIPVYIVGLVLLFPHAIMHESAVTFLGFGLQAETPAIGVILAEAMKHIATGKWWLALFPGAMLIMSVLLFYAIGEGIKRLLNPVSGNV